MLAPGGAVLGVQVTGSGHELSWDRLARVMLGTELGPQVVGVDVYRSMSTMQGKEHIRDVGCLAGVRCGVG